MQIGATFQMEQNARSQETVGKETNQNEAAGRSAPQQSTYPVQKDTVDVAKVQSPPLNNGSKVEAEKAPPPPPLGDGHKGSAQKGVASSSKPVQDGILRPWNDAAVNQIQVPGIVTPDKEKEQVEIQTKAEPVVKAIKEKVEHLFRVYPNGGAQSRAEKMDVVPHIKSQATATGSAPLAAARKQAASVDMYA
ncbi:MAG: hypothetical protein H7833_16855 [Magnetococcus sp. DMHC-1]|nr:hypothetical protein [Magnetococcales bacterium]